MKKWIIFLLSINVLTLAQNVRAEGYITMGTDAHKFIQKNGNLKSQLKNELEFIDQEGDVALFKVKSDVIPGLEHMMHEEFNRCAGYFYHETLDEAVSFLNKESEHNSLLNFISYTINQNSKVESALRIVSADEVLKTINKLSSFKNRYFQSKTGIASSEWIRDRWVELTKHRQDVEVELFKHNSWAQPSVILTIKGSTNPSEVVVLGGHADSISGWYDRANATAPGADDNASGIASITEVLRVMMQTNYKPTKTIKLMAYAAEEVGLRGSREIADLFKRQQVNVIGVIQLDMTNFHGSDFDIVLMDDYTNKAQNDFLAKLNDTYLQYNWGHSSCGYACSDHASWTANGYPASMPFEATMNSMNTKIHTPNDVIGLSGGVAENAAKFTKLGTSFLIEMAK